jgi:hypothetical protein
LTSEAEVDEVLRIVPEAVERLRALSPSWKQSLAMASV